MEGPEGRYPLWIATTEMPPYEPLDGDRRTQALVIGGGMTGLQTAYLLRGAGLEVTLIERGRVGRGVSGHTTAKVTALHGLQYTRLEGMYGGERASVYAAANRDALEAIVALAEREGIGCDLAREPMCTYATSPEERVSVEREAEAARRAGLAAEYRESLDLPCPNEGGVWLDGQARFHPARYMRGLAEAFTAAGGRLHEHTVALELDEEAVSVRTDHGVVSADHIVIATHFPVFDHGLLAMRVMPRSSYVLAGRLDEAPSAMYISGAEDYRAVRRQPAADGGSWAILNGVPHRTGEGGDTDARYGTLSAWARKSFAGLGDVEYAWSTHDIHTNDDLPFIGRYRKDRERLWTATGFHGWGMTHSMVAAMILSDGILGRENAWAGLYDPWERSLLEGAGKLLSQAATSVRHLVVDKIVSDDPSCTHMGCSTKWNEAERSWDCPCHGSRFDEGGAVLHGPAITPLSKPKPAPGRGA
jgi:glycine/D-amino acid oxidase-like deaminating enzyme/nitrite reductase/ring-hydroxylating ferredoxin subunit